MEINQVVVSASPGDAITNAAFELRRLLRSVCPSEIYARFIDPGLAGEVRELGRYAGRPGARPDADLLLFHASIGQPEVHSFVLERPERLVLIYHNVSPAEPFLPYDPAFAGMLASGRRELSDLAPRAALALAVSEYNAAELVDLGFTDVRVAPLIVDPAALRAVEPDAATTRHLDEVVTGPVALFVGQLLPHKRPDFLLEAHAALVTHLRPDAHLILVGSPRLERYRQALQLLVHELNLSHASIVGAVTQAQLVAFYRRADVFVTASEHEGFCVPILEAMAFDVPVVARAYAAVPETMGGTGVLLAPDDGPLVMTEALAMLAEDKALGRSLAAAGRRRLEHFSPDRARATVLEHLLSVA